MNAKVSDIVILRKLFKSQTPKAAAAYEAGLSDEARRIYRSASEVTWAPLEPVFEIYAKASAVLFPTAHEPMRELGREIGRVQMSGLYRIFLRVTTVEFLVKRVRQLWGTFYQTGTAEIENFTSTSGVFVVRGFPELVKTQREYIAGYLIGLLGLTGAQRVQVTCLDNDPQAWRWLLSWMR